MILSSKQRAFLRKYAHNLEPMMRVGKDGINENVIKSLEDLFRKRELVKVKMLQNSEDEIEETAEILSEGVGAEIIHILGKTILYYKENEKKPDISLKLKEIK
ncbi:MAG: ribosome assembly RNA-binding protein YhbY [Fusobacteria bacterium]|jgi:RNA-binding protein|nr:ribosome assembly RNA-binding protein YhbY [Fusobacteriota bacterium]